MKKPQILLAFIINCAVATSIIGQTLQLVPWLSGDQYGIANEAGDILIQPQYEDVVVFPDCPLALVKKGGLWGVVDKSGKVLIKPVIKGEITTPYNTLFAGVVLQSAFYPVMIGDSIVPPKIPLYTLQDPENRRIYYIHATNPSSSYAAFLDPELGPGKTLGGLGRTKEGMLHVITSDTLLNFMDTTGKLILEKGVTWGKPVSKDVLAVKNDVQKIVLYHSSGRLLFISDYDEIWGLPDGEILGEMYVNGNREKRIYELVSPTGEILLRNQLERPLIRDGMLITYDSITAQLRNTNAVVIASFPHARINFIGRNADRFALLIKGKTGLIDRNGNQIMAPTYDHLTPATSTLYYFKNKGRAGLVTENGHVVWERDSIVLDVHAGNPPGYIQIRKTNGNERSYGVVDSTGFVVAEPIYMSCQYKEWWNSFALVQKDSLAVVNMKGQIVFPMTFKASLMSDHPGAIVHGDTIRFYGSNFSVIAAVPNRNVMVTSKREAGQAYLMRGETKLTVGRYESLDKGIDIISSKPIFIGFLKDHSNDSLHVFSAEGKRIEPPGYVLWTRNAQNASDNAAALLLTNREDLKSGKRNPRRGLIDGTGKWIITPDTFDIWVVGGKLIIQQNRQLTYGRTYDMTGRRLHDIPYYYTPGRTDDGIRNDHLNVGFVTTSSTYEQYLAKHKLQSVKSRLATLSATSSPPTYMYGVMNTSGQEIWPVRFTSIEPFHFQYTIARELNDKGQEESVIISTSGKEMLRTPRNLKRIMMDDSTLVLFTQEEKFGLLDVSGHVVVEPVYSDIDIYPTNPNLILCRDSVNSFVINRSRPALRTLIGPSADIKLEKSGDYAYRTVIRSRENNVETFHWHYFDKQGKALTYIRAYQGDTRFNKQDLPVGYLALQDKPGAKYYLVNYITGKKYKAE